MMNILGGLATYSFFPKKPSLNLNKVNDGQLFLNLHTLWDSVKLSLNRTQVKII